MPTSVQIIRQIFRRGAVWSMIGAAALLGVACNSQSNAGSQPTVQVQSAPNATPYIPNGSPTLAGPIQIAQVAAGTPDTVIFIQNTGAAGSGSTASVDISDWKLEVGNTTVTLPAQTRIAPGATLAIHTGAGAASPVPSVTSVGVATPGTNQTLYLGPSGSALSQAMQPGAQVLLVDSRGTVVSQGVVPKAQ